MTSGRITGRLGQKSVKRLFFFKKNLHLSFVCDIFITSSDTGSNVDKTHFIYCLVFRVGHSNGFIDSRLCLTLYRLPGITFKKYL